VESGGKIKVTAETWDVRKIPTALVYCQGDDY